MTDLNILTYAQNNICNGHINDGIFFRKKKNALAQMSSGFPTVRNVTISKKWNQIQCCRWWLFLLNIFPSIQILLFKRSLFASSVNNAEGECGIQAFFLHRWRKYNIFQWRCFAVIEQIAPSLWDEAFTVLCILFIRFPIHKIANLLLFCMPSSWSISVAFWWWVRRVFFFYRPFYLFIHNEIVACFSLNKTCSINLGCFRKLQQQTNSMPFYFKIRLTTE